MQVIVLTRVENDPLTNQQPSLNYLPHVPLASNPPQTKTSRLSVQPATFTSN